MHVTAPVQEDNHRLPVKEQKPCGPYAKTLKALASCAPPFNPHSVFATSTSAIIIWTSTYTNSSSSTTALQNGYVPGYPPAKPASNPRLSSGIGAFSSWTAACHSIEGQNVAINPLPNPQVPAFNEAKYLIMVYKNQSDQKFLKDHDK
ncbi:hypothetical protein PtB15_5B437 [Puccinia triticina]|nr:hypothetical protein PtB15_5B437 [Puccinia triticina]